MTKFSMRLMPSVWLESSERLIISLTACSATVRISHNFVVVETKTQLWKTVDTIKDN